MHLQLGIVDAVPSDSRRCSCFKASQPDSQPLQRLAQSDCRVQSVRSALIGNIPDIDSAVQEGSRADDCRLHLIHRAQLGHQLADGSGFVCAQVAHLCLDDVQSLLLLQTALHLPMVGIPVRLHPQAVYRRSLSSIEHPALQKGGIRRLAHLSAQRVDLPHQMSLGSSSDGRVAGHISDCIEGHGKDCCLCTQASRSKRCLDARVSCTDDSNLIFPHIIFHRLLLLNDIL